MLRDRHWEVEHGLGQLVIVEVSNPLPSFVSYMRSWHHGWTSANLWACS
jgi:hypothetical protein